MAQLRPERVLPEENPSRAANGGWYLRQGSCGDCTVGCGEVVVDDNNKPRGRTVPVGHCCWKVVSGEKLVEGKWVPGEKVK